MSMIMIQFPEAAGTDCTALRIAIAIATCPSTWLYRIDIFTLGSNVQRCNFQKRGLMIALI